MDIVKMAKDAGMDQYQKLSDPPIPCASGTIAQLNRFAALVAEECAKLADDAANRAWNESRSEAWSDEFELLAKNIRSLIKSA